MRVAARSLVLSLAAASMGTGFSFVLFGSDRNDANLKHQAWGFMAATSGTLPSISGELISSGDTTRDKPQALDETPFGLVGGLATVCLYESDLRRDAVGKPGGTQASSATNWINEKSAFALQNAFDRIALKLPEERTGLDRDESSSWIRWMKMVPAPLIVELSDELRALANDTMPDASLKTIDSSRDAFLSRLGCRLILLPSGAALSNPLIEPPASIIYGKLLYGGATRYRSLVSSNSNRPPRKAGERTAVKSTVRDNVPTWMQYGGPNRMYEAVDMAAAAILEVMLLPFGKELEAITDSEFSEMVVRNMKWSPNNMFGFVRDDERNRSGKESISDLTLGFSPFTLSGKDRNDAFKSDFQISVGGLQPQIDAIVRRVLDGRIIRPAEQEDSSIGRPLEEDSVSAELSATSMEAEELALLGLTPVRGLLLYGPPGCGKTALAREISRALKARAPKIVSAPELLDRWVGGSEKLVRALFADAEAELAVCNGDATKSALHVVVIDEIDAVFRTRSSSEESGETTRSSVVNQILAKLDGVKAIPNVLLIGMTNRRELLDEALLRPGRLEVQIEIPLPDMKGRREILQIHFGELRRRGRLSTPLCCAIDGIAGYNEVEETSSVSDSSIHEQNDLRDPVEDMEARVRGRKRQALRNAMNRMLESLPRKSYDLAADYATDGFSGADISGLVRCAGSLALSRARRDGGGVENLLITLDDVKEALREVKT